MAFTIRKDTIRLSLGADFFFYLDTSSKDIFYSPQEHSKDMPANFPKILYTVIPEVDSFGFNDRYILAVSRKNNMPQHWSIDKSKEALEVGGTKDGRILMSNVSSIDKGTYQALRKKNAIQIYSCNYYRDTNK
jgi:hypothetical protein